VPPDIRRVGGRTRIREVLTRCLQKDLRKRYADIADVRYEIEQVLVDPGGLFQEQTSKEDAKPKYFMKTVLDQRTCSDDVPIPGIAMIKKLSTIWTVIALLFPGSYAFSQNTANAAYNFAKIADSVYFATGNGRMAVWSNSVIIVNEKDVMIVDSSVSPAAARALIADIKTLTDKPIRYVVNTHYHFDHAHGNQVFGPEAAIIGHEYTREQLMGDVLNSMTYVSFTGELPNQIETLQSQIENEKDISKKAELQQNLKQTKDFYQSQSGIKPTPPNLTFTDRMSIFKGYREIRLLYLGKGHTAGDVFVYLPEEKILCTGDFLAPRVSYMGDAYVDEWIKTLEKLKSIDFKVILPGHGEPMTTGEKIGYFQAFLSDLWDKTVEMRAKGISAEDVAAKIDLTSHKKNYPEIPGPGFDTRAIRRIYQLLDARENAGN
jgi:cyclase